METKVKTSFTRQLNKSAVPARTNLMLQEARKGAKARFAGVDDEAAVGLEGEDPEMEETIAKLKKVCSFARWWFLLLSG